MISKVNELKENQIFVFGSNEAGTHGKGAAKDAFMKFGAIYGKGEGLQGRSYAIPTKDHFIRTLSIDKIKVYVDRFLEFAKNNPQYEFILTPIGTGLAGYSPEEIKPLFSNAPKNIVLPSLFQ